jgi:hypothetical protein
MNMIRSLFILIALIPAFLQGQDPLEIKLNNFLDEWHSAAARADIQAYFERIDEDGIYIGTDASEHWTKQAFYDWSKPYFDKGKAWSFHAIERNISFSKDRSIAWFDEKLEASYGNLRGSGVLQLRNGEWKIMQYILSLPVPNEKFKEILEAISEK